MEVIYVWCALALLYGSIHAWKAWSRRRMLTPRNEGWSLLRVILTLFATYIASCCVLLGIWVVTYTRYEESSSILTMLMLVTMCHVAVFLGWLMNRSQKALRQKWAQAAASARANHLHETELREREANRLEQESSRRIRDAAQRKREEIRARCEAAFHIHGPEIADRFPRSAFDQFCTRYLGDDKTPEVVEARARELLAIIQSYVNKIDPVKVKPSLESILSTFDERRQKVTRAGLETNDEKYLLTQLNELRDEAIRKAVMEGTL